jgi:hypothetical protein
MPAPVVAAVIGLLTGAALPAGTLGAILPAGLFSAAQDVDTLAARVASYAPAVCKATDTPLDRLMDAYDARADGKVTFWRRALDDMTAAADSVCRDVSNKPNTALNRVKAIVHAVEAAQNANSKLSALATAPIVTPTVHIGR